MIKLKTLTKNEQKALEEFKNKLLEKLGRKVVLIKLYGSKARGDFHKESDIDILAVLKNENRKTEDLLIDTQLMILDKYGVYLSLVSFDLKEFKRLTNLQTNFILNVAEEGINLWPSPVSQKI